MNRALKAGLLSAGMLIMGAGAYLKGKPAFDRYLDDRIHTAIEQTRDRVRVDLSLTRDGTPLTTDGSCAAGQVFAREKRDLTYLDTKVGFRYEIEDITYVPREGFPDIPLGIFQDRYGTITTFSVERGYANAYEQIMIMNANGSMMDGSFVIIEDKDRDELPDHINIRDQRNNTSIAIIRNPDGVLRYDTIDEPTARQIYDIFTQAYRTFKREHDIDNRMAQYEPRVEIQQIIPGRGAP